LTTNRSLRIYTKLVGTSRTDNDSTTNPENGQFLEIRGFRGRSVIGVLRILTNPEIGQFLAILGIRGRSVIGALESVGVAVMPALIKRCFAHAGYGSIEDSCEFILHFANKHLKRLEDRRNENLLRIS